MKNEKVINSTPPPSLVSSKRFCRFLCVVFCTLFAFALVGCGDTYSDEDDYANFVRWQARYEAEKELVGLLREYDAAYRSYIDYTEKSKDALPNNDTASLAFVFEGRTVLTDENIKLVQSGYDASYDSYVVTVLFDSVGTAIFAELTSSNIGGVIEIVEIRNGQSSVLSSPVINSAISNGRAVINGNFTAESATDLYLRIAAKTADRSVRLAASAYNNKRSESAVRYSMPEYLPASLAVTPEYTDAAVYLQKAEAIGFTA